MNKKFLRHMSILLSTITIVLFQKLTPNYMRIKAKNRNHSSAGKKESLAYGKPPRMKFIFGILGPGFITASSDDDPSGIATFSQAGARYGLGMLWLVLIISPMMVVIQEICARIGLVTGSGLASAIKKKYSKKTVYPLVILLLIANTINIGADIGAMAASVRLLFPQVPIIVATLSFAMFIVSTEILVPYKKYVKILKYLTLSLFAYVITAIIVGGNWGEILAASIVPHIEFNAEFAMMFVAIFGTSISSYLFFWQASQEAEEDVARHKIKEIGKGRPKIAKQEVKIMREDVAVGIAFSNIIVWAIIVTTAGSLHNNGITDIQSAEDAARALEPLVQGFPHAGEVAKAIFALGIIGTGLLSVPILAGASGYALADAFGWKEGLNKKFKQAKSFYLVIAISTILGMLLDFSGINPISALIYAAIVNGIVSVPILVAIMKIANDKKLLDGKTNGYLSNIIGWITVLVMGASVVIMLVTFGR